MKGESLLMGDARGRLRFSCLLMTVLACLLPEAESSTVFKVYPLADDYFEKVYLVNHNSRQHYLIVSCKERNILSLSVSESR